VRGLDFALMAEVEETLLGTEDEPMPTLPLGRLGGADELLPITLIDRYRIERRLGAGAMGVVYAAHDIHLDRAVAVKVVGPRVDTGTGQGRLVREAQAMAKLRHPNLATVYDIGVSKDRLFVVMEIVDGGTVADWLKAEPRSWRAILAVYLQAACGLTAAHAAGFVHRDFKPENVLYGNDGVARVSDFGVARILGDAERADPVEGMAVRATVTRSAGVVGTPGYIAPEILRHEPVDERADQFSFCVALYAALHGERPFERIDGQSRIDETLGSVKPPRSGKVPRWVSRIVTRGLSADPGDRWPTINALAVAVERRLGSRRRALVLGALAVTAMMVALMFVIAERSAPLPPPERSQVALGAFSEMSISRLTTSGKITHAAISRDGRYVAHVSVDADGESLWVGHVSAPSSTRVAGPAATEYVSVTFAPSGDSVYYLTLDRDKGDPVLYRVPVLGGPSSMVVSSVGPVGFSPDGSQIAFLLGNKAKSHLIVADADGAHQRTLATRRQPEFLNWLWAAPAWSPDGKTIACPVWLSDERGQYATIAGVSVADGSLTPLTSQRWSSTGQPAWLADGSGLLLTASESATAPVQVWHVALDGGEARRVTHDLNDYQDLSLTADASTLTAVQVHSASSIWVAPEADANRVKQIASNAGWIQDTAWTPDGRIVFSSSAGGSAEVWVMNADGSNPKQLTTGARVNYGLTVSPDGHSIFFASDRAGRFNIWRVDSEGGGLKQLTVGGGESHPRATPDARWVVYQRGEVDPKLWKVPADGGEPVQLTQTRAQGPAVSPDGKLIAYHHLDSDVDKSRWRIGVVSSAGGPRLKWFDLPPTVTQRVVRWSHDGQSIAFVNSPGGLSDIWLQPLDGSPPSRLTTFKAEQILAFDWSRDGRSLALVRGVETSEVVLIRDAALK
jgi:Tol biopolymer transport system component